MLKYLNKMKNKHTWTLALSGIVLWVGKTNEAVSELLKQAAPGVIISNAHNKIKGDNFKNRMKK
jgi:hypothetical protein